MAKLTATPSVSPSFSNALEERAPRALRRCQGPSRQSICGVPRTSRVPSVLMGKGMGRGIHRRGLNVPVKLCAILAPLLSCHLRPSVLAEGLARATAASSRSDSSGTPLRTQPNFLLSQQQVYFDVTRLAGDNSMSK
ncbi:hypothetical protein GOP47_0027514 [Adiantum capillus-veneris]|nr:hypothetical protein GOP47_0027514 [Adiantum capillus-veneris]